MTAQTLDLPAPEDPTARLAATAPGSGGPLGAGSGPSRELAAAALHLLRIRRGELAEPAGWARPDVRRNVAAIVFQLLPIRSRAALASSYAREAGRGEALRIAYAIAWLGLDRRLTSIRTRRRSAAGGVPRSLSRVRGRG